MVDSTHFFSVSDLKKCSLGFEGVGCIESNVAFGVWFITGERNPGSYTALSRLQRTEAERAPWWPSDFAE